MDAGASSRIRIESKMARFMTGPLLKNGRRDRRSERGYLNPVPKSGTRRRKTGVVETRPFRGEAPESGGR
jgi:hypothetical protein